MKDSVIEVSNLKKSYGKTPVLKGISFEVERGSMLALLGPNGAGKTTIVKILSTLLKPDSGFVSIDGTDLEKAPDEVRKKIGLTGQSASVDELLTGRENLVMMGQLYRLTTNSAKNRATELLAQFNLEKAADRQVKTYSGGMRRRLDLAVSLIASPPIIFLDEPTTGLDPRSRLVLWDIIKKLLKDGTTILLTTQYLEEADQLANKIIVIDNGKVIASGTSEELKSKIGNDRLELVFGSKNDLENAEKLLAKKVITKDEESNRLSIDVKNIIKDVKNSLAALENDKINVVSMEVHRPTLDDVFLSLTSRNISKKDKK